MVTDFGFSLEMYKVIIKKQKLKSKRIIIIIMSNPCLGVVALFKMDEWTHGCLSPFTTCSERGDVEQPKLKKNKSGWSSGFLSLYLMYSYRPNKYYLIIKGGDSVPEKDVERCS